MGGKGRTLVKKEDLEKGKEIQEKRKWWKYC